MFTGETNERPLILLLGQAEPYRSPRSREGWEDILDLWAKKILLSIGNKWCRVLCLKRKVSEATAKIASLGVAFLLTSEVARCWISSKMVAALLRQPYGEAQSHGCRHVDLLASQTDIVGCCLSPGSCRRPSSEFPPATSWYIQLTC
jgi:hypothetical protein